MYPNSEQAVYQVKRQIVWVVINRKPLMVDRSYLRRESTVITGKGYHLEAMFQLCVHVMGGGGTKMDHLQKSRLLNVCIELNLVSIAWADLQGSELSKTLVVCLGERLLCL